MALTETYETWENLQKGQIAELAFERIALACGYAVEYAGRQYSERLEPSEFRKNAVEPQKPDFKVWRRTSSGWEKEPFAVVEVKWRDKREQAPKHLPSGATHLVVFTPDEFLCAKKEEYQGWQSLKPLEKSDLGFTAKRFQTIKDAATNLIGKFASADLPKR